MAPNPIILGAFELHTVIGQGGMGQVWRGLHTSQRIPVAVKVVTRDYAREEKYLAGFRSEVRALAQLDHPGIVMVFDYGEIPAATAEASQGQLVEGSPFLVMEYAGSGSLSRVRGPLDWDELKGVLLFLLEVLAHAHARGVVHRDLKPANILFAGPDDVRPGPKLTDFGIAFARDAPTQGYLAKGSLGSPAYMAPEQWFGDWRDYGPWTDLYAVGCIAYQLATGAPPFLGDTTLAIANAHMSRPPPPLAGTRVLPEGFEAWVRRLLQKEPHHRFQWAHDAAMALSQLPDPEEQKQPRVSRGAGDLQWAGVAEEDISPTAVTDGVEVEPAAQPTVLISGEQRFGRQSHAGLDLGAGRSDCCPIPTAVVPSTWMTATPPARSIRLVGVGLGIYGLRSIPLVDRQQELDRLWQSLLAVYQEKRPHLVVLQGPAGCGKSRLAQWICERASELGAATILKAVHSPLAGPGAGLARMMARHFQCVGLSRHEVTSRLRISLRRLGSGEEYEWNALTELIESAGESLQEPQASMVRFTSSKQRYALLGRILERLTSSRPAIVWLDDVQWGMDSLQFAEHLIGEPSAGPLPVLMILTAQEQALAGRHMERESLEHLVQRPRTGQIPVGPLEGPHHFDLIRNLLFLQGDLAEQVERRSGGNPLFAIQLIGDWVRRGVLEVGPEGFALRHGERAVLPDDIHMVWIASLDQMVEQYARLHSARGQSALEALGKPGGLKEAQQLVSQQTQQVLEIATALGQVVDRFEWQQVCDRMGLPCPLDLPDALIRSQLAQPHESGFTLVHGMFRESLERLAREAGRWQRINRAAASMLGAVYPDRPRGISGRLGLHLVEAGEHQEALVPLLDAAHERCMQTDFPDALRLLDLREASLDLLAVPPDDLRRAEGWLLRSRILIHQADYNAARRWAERAGKAARSASAKGALAESLQLVGLTSLWRGQLKPAAEMFGRALELYRDASDRKGVARTLFHLGSTQLQQGEWSEAEKSVNEALLLSYQIPDWETWADSLRKLALVALKREDYDQATALNQQALDYYNREGHRYGVAACWNSLGNIHFTRGDRAAAEQAYRQVIAMLCSIGVYGEMIGPQLNLCLILLDTGQYEEARQQLEPVLQSCRERGVRVYLGAAHSLALAAAAGVKDWYGWSRHFDKASSLLEETGQSNSDIAWALKLAGDLALAAGEPERARQAYLLAQDCYRRGQEPDKVAELQQALNACPELPPTKEPGGA
ncbi:MAG: tetratricopeptide repeat protein [Bradymonadales bacterium]|nr:tetratricopeptide repeat protein [Bradymonadales bacterium]